MTHAPWAAPHIRGRVASPVSVPPRKASVLFRSGAHVRQQRFPRLNPCVGQRAVDVGDWVGYRGYGDGFQVADDGDKHTHDFTRCYTRRNTSTALTGGGLVIPPFVSAFPRPHPRRAGNTCEGARGAPYRNPRERSVQRGPFGGEFTTPHRHQLRLRSVRAASYRVVRRHSAEVPVARGGVRAADASPQRRTCVGTTYRQRFRYRRARPFSRGHRGSHHQRARAELRSR